MDLLQRDGDVRAMMVPPRHSDVLQREIRANVDPGTSMRLSTTPRSTSVGASIPTASKTSGACSSA